MATSGCSPSADCYLQFAHELREKCHRLSHIKGALKLERKIIAEVKFLRNLLRRNSAVQESHLKSSNLGHYAAIVHAAENVPGTIEILQPFSCPGKSESLIVDVVACQGHVWVKVIARKAQALHLIWAGQGQFGERDLLRQADDYLDSAEKHPRNFTTPEVYFVFYNNVTIPMSLVLQDSGIQVLGHQVPVDGRVKQKLMHLQEEEEEEEGGQEDGEVEFSGPGTGPELGRADVEEVEEDFSSRIMSASEFLSASFSTKQHDSLHAESGSKCENNNESFVPESAVNSSGDVISLEAHDLEGGVRGMVGAKCSLVPTVGDSVPGECQVDSALHDLSVSKPLHHNIDTHCLSSSSDLTLNIREDLCSAQERHCISESTSVGEHLDVNHGLQCKQSAEVHEGSRSSRTKKDLGSNRNNSPTDLPCGSTMDATSHSPTDSPVIPASGSISCDNQADSAACIPSKRPASSKSSCSSNYMLLMSELLGVLPVLPAGIQDRSTHIINSIFRVNLDITTLITLVSAVTHGNCNYVFTENILTMQAAEEREKPVLPDLLDFMKGKELYACRSAVDDFNTILSTLGGDGEKQRAAELLARVKVVEDKPSQKAQTLQNLGKIKDRSKVIFGTGDSLEAITMTANSGFLRAAESQDVSFAVFVHAARALTEDKEKTATPISDHAS
ncbi:UPF0415 protein C7orf25 homolog [Haliotis asinina]|uniref:UPF0415 protein C7orf25 homolog n=1 Tax=Haliotis asinina TaxID=109174 RepID=UPI0035319504